MSRTAALIRTATCRVARDLHEGTGEHLTARQLVQRVGRLSSLVPEAGQTTIGAHWDRAPVAPLTSDTTPPSPSCPTRASRPAGDCGVPPGSPQAPPVRHASPAWGTNRPRANSAQPGVRRPRHGPHLPAQDRPTAGHRAAAAPRPLRRGAGGTAHTDAGASVGHEPCVLHRADRHYGIGRAQRRRPCHRV